MRNVLIVMMAALLAGVLAGCSGTSDTRETADTGTDAEATYPGGTTGDVYGNGMVALDAVDRYISGEWTDDQTLIVLDMVLDDLDGLVDPVESPVGDTAVKTYTSLCRTDISSDGASGDIREHRDNLADALEQS